VFVFIYGGGLTSGSAVDKEYTNNTHKLSAAEDIIVVTVNYRVGPLGFFASEPETRNNCPGAMNTTGGMNGALDVLMGLSWVFDHISSFGGDPDRITLGGESGGSQIVCFLAHSPLIVPLRIHNFIFESGSCVGPWEPDTMEVSLSNSKKYLSELKHKHPSDFSTYPTDYESLKQLPAKYLLDVDFGFDTTSKIAGLDGYLLDQLPRKSDLAVSMTSRALLGTNDLDSYCGPPWDCTNYANRSQLVEYIALLGFGLNDSASIVDYYHRNRGLSVPSCAYEIGYQYGGCDKSPASVWTRIFWQIQRDVSVACPTEWLARKFAQHNSQQTDAVFLYWEDLKHKNYSCTQDYHGGELQILFGNKRDMLPNVTKSVQDHWGSFMKGSVPWDAFQVDKDNYWSINYPKNESHMGAKYADYFTCGFWAEYIERSAENMAKFEKFGWFC